MSPRHILVQTVVRIMPFLNQVGKHESKHNATLYPSTRTPYCAHDLPHQQHHLHQSRPHQYRFLAQPPLPPYLQVGTRVDRDSGQVSPSSVEIESVRLTLARVDGVWDNMTRVEGEWAVHAVTPALLTC